MKFLSIFFHDVAQEYGMDAHGLKNADLRCVVPCGS